MKLKTGILLSFLVIGLLIAPNCIFAQEYEDSASNAVIQSSVESNMVLNSLTPLIKGGGGGGRGGGSSSSKSVSKAVKKADGDDDDTTSSDDGSGWWITAIIIIIILGIIGVLIWYFVLRK